MRVYFRPCVTANIVLSIIIIVVIIAVVLLAYIGNNKLLRAGMFENEVNDSKSLTRLAYDNLPIDINLINMLIEQRNNASRKANELQQKIGQMQCQIIEKSNHSHTSQTGGWCKNSGIHVVDEDLAKALADMFKGKRVASFGDGSGKYKQLVEDSGKGVTYHAYDGGPFSEEISQGSVKFLDLTLAQYGLPLYDWIISIEVAEHIPGEFEGVYINNICRHAKEGVVLSWAVPGQGGYAHINNRPFDYVVKIMHDNGFNHDLERSKILKKAAKVEWLQKNLNVYLRRNWMEYFRLIHLLT